MKIPNLKLSFQISRTTNLDDFVIVYNIRQVLGNKKYRVRALSENNIIFDFNPWRFVWNHQAPYILDGGDFKISTTGEVTTVTMNYFIDLLWPLIQMAAILVLLIIQEFYIGILFFAAFFLIASTFQYFTTRNVGRELLDEILDSDII